MVSTIASAIPAALSYMLSATVFEELPSLPECVLFLLSSSVIPSVIEIPDDPEVDELVSEVTEEIVFVSGGPLLASSSHVSCPFRSRRVKTPRHIISESLNTSSAPQAAPPDFSNGLVVSAPVCHHNPTISIQPVVGPSRKQGCRKGEPPAVFPPSKKPRRNKAHKSFSLIFYY